MDDCPKCEYNKSRAARWRAEAYRQAGHDVIELPWVGLTLDEKKEYLAQDFGGSRADAMDWADKRLKEKNT